MAPAKTPRAISFPAFPICKESKQAYCAYALSARAVCSSAPLSGAAPFPPNIPAGLRARALRLGGFTRPFYPAARTASQRPKARRSKCHIRRGARLCELGHCRAYRRLPLDIVLNPYANKQALEKNGWVVTCCFLPWLRQAEHPQERILGKNAGFYTSPAALFS